MKSDKSIILIFIVISVITFTANDLLSQPAAEAYAKIARSDWSGAESAFTKAIEEGPNGAKDINCFFSAIYGGRGFVRLKQNKYLDAVKDLEISLKYDCSLLNESNQSYYKIAIAELKIDNASKISYDGGEAYKNTVYNYFSAIDNQEIEKAVSFFVDSKRDKVRNVIKKIAAETDYYKIISINPTSSTRNEMTVQVSLIQKRWAIDNAESWNITMHLEKYCDSCEWLIERIY